MNVQRATEIADRKALLAARASLDRTRVAVAVHDIRTLIAPPRAGSIFGRAQPAAAMLVRFVAPLLGATRLRRIMRLATIALMVYRVARSWRSAPR